MTEIAQRSKNGYSAPTGLDIRLIDPALHPKYSPNLFAYLNARKNTAQLRLARVFTDKEGTKFIGFMDDTGCLIGARLSQVLTEGAKTSSWSFCGAGAWAEHIGFWGEYIADGRCAIDRAHKMPFIGSEHRWHVQGEHRSCLWCGKASQVLRKRVRQVIDERWEPEDLAA